MATYNKPVGEQINEPFKGKVILSNSSLSSSSITLKNVTWADENCYVCSFNVYPDGSKRKQICLKVEGISEMHKKNSSASSSDHKDREEKLSCSATGKPAPKISWNTSKLKYTDAPPTTVINSDGSITTSSNITVQVPTDWTGHVYCVVNQGLLGQRQEEFSFSSQEKEKEEGTHAGLKSLTIVAIIICVTVVASVLVHKR
uniref:Ig-like domain-containing protein n=1 Tax=Poecilia mexicana TaxID=48701 RepID=A0A3B3WRP0_9TELE